MRAMSCLNFYKEEQYSYAAVLTRCDTFRPRVIRILSHRHRLGVKYVIA